MMAETLCGSPLYMAPEILRYEKYDAKADLWSVGAVLYEMSAGKAPFRAQNHIELLKKIEQTKSIKFPDEDPAMLEKDPALKPVPSDIKKLIRSLLRRFPAERSSYDEFFKSSALANSKFPKPPKDKDRDRKKSVSSSLVSKEPSSDLGADAEAVVVGAVTTRRPTAAVIQTANTNTNTLSPMTAGTMDHETGTTITTTAKPSKTSPATLTAEAKVLTQARFSFRRHTQQQQFPTPTVPLPDVISGTPGSDRCVSTISVTPCPTFSNVLVTL
jgi:serine/threonine-protein kinase ULK2